MKLLPKLLLFLCIVFAGIYAATPLWLPYILATQLPPGWQLETLETGYPDLAGINIHSLRLRGEIQTVGLALAATDIDFNYWDMKIDMGPVSLDVTVRAVENRSAVALTLDDLSLPVTRLSGKLPELSVSQLRVALHHGTGIETGNNASTRPLVLNCEAFKLIPRSDNSFHLATRASIEEFSAVTGQLVLDVSTNLTMAEIRFPAAADSPPWLAVKMEQTDRTVNTATRIQFAFDAEPADREWLDSILVRSTGGVVTHVNGKLEVHADFAGKNLQGIELLWLTTEQLKVVSSSGTLDLNAELLASREGEKVIVRLPVPADIQYQDRTGLIDDLLTNAVPGLQRTHRPVAMALLELDANSSFAIQPGPDSAMEFNGGIKLDLTSDEERINLQASNFHIKMEDFSSLDSTVAEGLITLNWAGSAPFIYTFDDAPDPPMTVTAAGMSINAKLFTHNGSLLSTGGGTFTDGRIMPLAISATRTDMTWQELDLLSLAGKLGTKTQGFAAEYDGEIWKGFNFDVSYTLLSNADVSGSGTLKFDSSLEFPIEFAGNTQKEQWNITLPPATVKLAQLRGLLRVAHFELPASIKLTDGYIDLLGKVAVGDEITAKMAINGHEMGASMLKSSASKASFNFDTEYGDTVSASGPISIEAVALAGGIDVTHIRADLKFENTETFALQNLYAEVFDGQIKLGNLRFSDNRIEDTTVELSHINFGRLLAFVDIDGLQGTGLLDVSLPAGSDQTGVHIKNGTFSSAGPGRLAYTKEGVAGSNIGLQALENFQYQVLSGTLDYQSDGAYQIAIHLEGENPDLYGGHPIVFNLNINGSLPELFEALFITGDFEESILKQIGVDKAE
jgi:hypothetical protein